MARETLDQLLDVRASCADSATLEDHLGMTMSVGAFCVFWFTVSLVFRVCGLLILKDQLDSQLWSASV